MSLHSRDVRANGSDPDWEAHKLSAGASSGRIDILLRRLVRNAGPESKADRSVLLLPGANSSCRTFLIPDAGLAGYLGERGFDVWMLDWRPSPVVINELPKKFLGGSANAERLAFTLDVAVEEDIPAALTFIRKEIRDRKLSVLGHCVGGGGLAMAIARGKLVGFDVDRIVLSTLGLFYEVPWNTWVKAEDFLLERMFLPSQQPDCRFIDPKDASDWPQSFAEAFDRWPREWLPGGTSKHDEFLQRLSFMVGQPYLPDKLAPSIVGDPVEAVFGPLHAGLYTHLGQMVRRGYSARFDVQDQIDRAGIRDDAAAPPGPKGDLDLTHFKDHAMILVAAGDNGVWHRDAIDLMYEWLRRDRTIVCEKHVIAGYNIQELFWAKDARSRTYEMFARSLQGG